MKIKGLYTALITPFKEEGGLDQEGFCRLIRYQMAAKADGICVLGTTGEAPTIDSNEREELIELAIGEANKKIPVMVGVGTNCTKTAIANAVRAEKAGASSLLLVNPYYNRPQQEGLYLHAAAVARAVSTPICLYNIPSRSGVNMEVGTVERLAKEFPHVVAIKEASGNLNAMIDIIDRVGAIRDDFALICGDDLLILAAMAVGGSGGISATANLTPRAMKKVIDIALSNPMAAKELLYTLKPVISGVTLETNPVPIKKMCELARLPAGPCRLPLAPMAAANIKKLEELIESNALIREEIRFFEKL
jgi:4-hydroxy-tetrahydrodipicolinate synthase